MKVARSVAEVLSQHTTLALECIDRLYLNVYVPVLPRAAGAAYFHRTIRGCSVPSSVLMAPITQRFVDAIKRFADHNRIDIVSFRRGERKDDRTQEYLRKWTGHEGVLYIGKTQEKARVLRTERRHNPATGGTYAWLVSSTAMVNHFYFYAVDDYKEGRALRTETVINDTYDFGIGRRLRNLDDLKKIGFAANRRLLGVQTLSHDCTIGADVLDGLHRPAHIDGQRASALRFGDPRVQALCAALLQFDLLPHGFRIRELRETVAPLCGLSLEEYGPVRMTYDLRRLRLRGIIVRIPDTQRYQLTADGLCIALAYHRTQARASWVRSCRSRSTGNRPRGRMKPSPCTTARSATFGKGRRSPPER